MYESEYNKFALKLFIIICSQTHIAKAELRVSCGAVFVLCHLTNGTTNSDTTANMIRLSTIHLLFCNLLYGILQIATMHSM